MFGKLQGTGRYISKTGYWDDYVLLSDYDYLMGKQKWPFFIEPTSSIIDQHGLQRSEFLIQPKTIRMYKSPWIKDTGLSDKKYKNYLAGTSSGLLPEYFWTAMSEKSKERSFYLKRAKQIKTKRDQRKGSRRYHQTQFVEDLLAMGARGHYIYKGVQGLLADYMKRPFVLEQMILNHNIKKGGDFNSNKGFQLNKQGQMGDQDIGGLKPLDTIDKFQLVSTGLTELKVLRMPEKNPKGDLNNPNSQRWLGDQTTDIILTMNGKNYTFNNIPIEIVQMLRAANDKGGYGAGSIFGAYRITFGINHDRYFNTLMAKTANKVRRRGEHRAKHEFFIPRIDKQTAQFLAHSNKQLGKIQRKLKYMKKKKLTKKQNAMKEKYIHKYMDIAYKRKLKVNSYERGAMSRR